MAISAIAETTAPTGPPIRKPSATATTRSAAPSLAGPRGDVDALGPVDQEGRPFARALACLPLTHRAREDFLVLTRAPDPVELSAPREPCLRQLLPPGRILE